MNVWNGDDREPTPEELTAYLDGEFEGEDALLPKKQAIADWLTNHPEANNQLAAWRKLKLLWHETTPPSPDEDRWSLVLSGIQSGLDQSALPGVPSRRLPWGWMFGAAAAVLLVVGALAVQRLANLNKTTPANPVPSNLAEQPSKQPAPEAPGLILPDEPWPMALPEEIEILRVAGNATENVLIGHMPLEGTMQLAGTGEVEFLDEVENPPRTNMEPRTSNEPPMVWVISSNN
jgi:hypothetical protein